MMRVAKMLNNGKAHKPALKGRPQHQRNVLSLGVTKWLVNGLTITLLFACLHSGTCQDFSGLSSRKDWWWPFQPGDNPQIPFMATEIKVLAINETARRAERNTNDIAATTLRSRYPLTGDEIRYQVVVRGPGGRWYTRGAYNPRRLQNTYFDSRGWVVVAYGSLVIPGSPTEEVPRRVYKFDFDEGVLLRFIDVSHVVDTEHEFTGVISRERYWRYYMYLLRGGELRSGDKWYTTKTLNGIGIKAIGAHMVIGRNRRVTHLFAGPLPGMRASRPFDLPQWPPRRNVSFNQSYDEGSGALDRGRRVIMAGGSILQYVYPSERYRTESRFAAPSSDASLQLAIEATSLVGAPYEWGGKRYSPRGGKASDVVYDPVDQFGEQGFGLDCSGLVYVSLVRANARYGYYSWIRREDRLNFGVYRIAEIAESVSGGQPDWRLGDLLIKNDYKHVAIYLGIGKAVAAQNGGVIFPKVVESVGFNGNGRLDSYENHVRVATLSNPSAYHARRLPLQR